VAVRLGHKNMENMLLNRVNEALEKEEISRKNNDRSHGEQKHLHRQGS
jgi:hypothetical protein